MKKHNKCWVCGKTYEFQIKIYCNQGEYTCKHDDSFLADTLYFTKWEKKLAEKIHKQRKVVVKGSDGILRIAKPVKMKNER